ncbi:MAG: DUF4349 domain-containing protein [Chloroflexi bacterium]|nr:DUF4349 domain-containing protein [Chloroflexota bacterium]
MISRWVLLLPGLIVLVLVACASPAPSPVSAPVAPNTASPAAPAPATAAARLATPAPTSAPAPTTAPAAAPTKPAAAGAAAAAAPRAAEALVPAPAQSRVSATDAPGSTELLINQNLGRKIIYTTDITMLVEDAGSFPSAAARIALGHGGYVAGVETREEAGIPTTIVRLKIPPERYEAAMSGLRGLALEVRGEKATTQDVTEEYNDVQTQLASLEATHAQLLEIQKRATTVDEVLRVQQQAAQVKLQIDRLKGRATALDRLSEFATITVKALAAAAAIERDYVSERAALRRANSALASLDAQLRRSRTPEEEAGIRDRMGETVLEVSRRKARLDDLERKAELARMALPRSEDAPAAPQGTDTLPQQHIEARVALRRAEYQQTELTRALRAGVPGVDPKDLSKAILEVSRRTGELKAIQERANQLGITLPTLTAEQEAALSGIPAASDGPDILASIRAAWESSLRFIVRVATKLVSAVVFLWWLLPLAAVGFFVLRRLAPTIRRRLAPSHGSMEPGSVNNRHAEA